MREAGGICRIPGEVAAAGMVIAAKGRAFVAGADISEFGKPPAPPILPDLLAAISGWIRRRHGIEVEPARITALNGTREGLFNAALALCPERKNGGQPVVLIPNPFYQVYAVAAAAVQAEALFVPATPATGNLPDYAGLDPALLDRVALAYLCSPANPQGSVADDAYLEDLIALVSLCRPGPMDLIPSFVAHKHGKEVIEYPHPLLGQVLELRAREQTSGAIKALLDPHGIMNPGKVV